MVGFSHPTAATVARLKLGFSFLDISLNRHNGHLSFYQMPISFGLLLRLCCTEDATLNRKVLPFMAFRSYAGDSCTQFMGMFQD
jgi:hypothetical protein